MKKYVVITEKGRFTIEAETVKVNAETKQIEFYSNQKCNIVEVASDTSDGKEKIIGEGVMQGMVALFPIESTVFFLKSDSMYDMFNGYNMVEFAKYFNENIKQFPDMPTTILLKWIVDVYNEKENEPNKFNQIFEAFKTTHYLYVESLKHGGGSGTHDITQVSGNEILIEKYETKSQ